MHLKYLNRASQFDDWFECVGVHVCVCVSLFFSVHFSIPFIVGGVTFGTCVCYWRGMELNFNSFFASAHPHTHMYTMSCVWSISLMSCNSQIFENFTTPLFVRTTTNTHNFIFQSQTNIKYHFFVAWDAELKFFPAFFVIRGMLYWNQFGHTIFMSNFRWLVLFYLSHFQSLVLSHSSVCGIATPNYRHYYQWPIHKRISYTQIKISLQS